MKLLLLVLLLLIPNVYAAETFSDLTIVQLEAHPDRGLGIEFKNSTGSTIFWAFLDINQFTNNSKVYDVWVSMMLMAYATKQNLDVTINTNSAGYAEITTFKIK